MRSAKLPSVENALGRHKVNGANVFRILIVDDNPADAHLLTELMKNLQRAHEEYTVTDGLEALDFLHCRGVYQNAPRPNLILLDVNMPRLTGVETLSAIKGDSELSVIPVIMLSTSNSPDEVRRCYQAHANVYVQKPTELERSDQLIRAIEAFWMDFAILPSSEERGDSSRSNGHSHGYGSTELPPM